MSKQTFTDTETGEWLIIDFLPGVEIMPLAQPVPGGSIHRARLSKGTVIPMHTHPTDEYVFVLSGTIETSGKHCDGGAFWITPAGTRQGPHIAVTEVDLLTVRLGPMGPFSDGAG